MAGPLDIDDDMQRMVLRKGEATAMGGHAFQRLLQLADTRAHCPTHLIAVKAPRRRTQGNTATGLLRSIGNPPLLQGSQK